MDEKRKKKRKSVNKPCIKVVPLSYTVLCWGKDANILALNTADIEPLAVGLGRLSVKDRGMQIS